MNDPRPADRISDCMPLGIAIAFTVIAIYAVDYLPTNDGPKMAYAGFARAHLGEEPFASHFTAHWPVTSWLWPAVFGLLERLLHWREAYRLCVAATAAGWVLGVHTLVAALPRPRRALVWLLGAGSLQWALYMGFFSFLASMSMGMAAFGIALQETSVKVDRKRWMKIGALLALASVTHPFGAQLGGLGVFLHTLLAVPRSGWRRRIPPLFLVGLLPMATTIGALIALDAIADHPAMIGHEAYSPPWQERWMGLSWFYTSGPWYRAYPPVAAAALALGLAIVRINERTLRPRERALLAVGLVYLALGLLVDRHGTGWKNFSPRFVPVALAMLVTLLPLEALRGRAIQLTQLTLAIVFATSTGWAIDYHLRLRAESEPWLTALEVPAAGTRTLLPLVTRTILRGSIDQRRDFEVPFARPHVATGSAYAMARNAVAPYGFTHFPHLHLVEGPSSPPKPGLGFQDTLQRWDPAARHRELTRLAIYAARYDEVLLIGTADQVELFEGRGFEPMVKSDTLFLGSFRGCPTKLTVTGPNPPPEMVVVVGWEPWPRSAWDTTWQPARLPAQRELPMSACGPLWIRVAVAGGHLRCANEDAQKRLLTTGGTNVSCELRAD